MNSSIDADLDVSARNVTNVIDYSEFVKFSPLLGLSFIPNLNSCIP